MTKRQVVLGAALTALVSAGTTLKASKAQADDHATAQPAAEGEKNSCKGKDACKGKKKKAAHAEEKDKNSCKGKNNCSAKADEHK